MQADSTFEDEPVVQYYLSETVVGTDMECELSAVGGDFNPVGYGLAFSRDSSFFIPYSQAIIHLQEIGELTKLAKQWRIGPYAALPTCDGDTDDSGQFFISEMWGLIAVTAGFIILGLLVALSLAVGHPHFRFSGYGVYAPFRGSGSGVGT